MGLANSPTSGASADGLLKLEDAVASSGDAGVGILLKRTDTAATQTSATGDYTLPVANLNGAQLIDINRTFQASDPNGLLKAEDVAAVSGDAGVYSLAVRADTAASTTSATGDYSQFSVNSFGATLVDVRSDFQSSATLGLLKIEDAVSASGDAGVLTFGIRRDALDTNQTSNAGDYGTFIVDALGRQIFVPYATSTSYVYGNASTTGTTTTSVVAAPAGSLRNYITNISITNTGSTTSLITLQDGSGGATLWQTVAVAGGGSNITFNIPIRTTAATALFFIAASASTTIYVSASGFTAL